ncbi:putative phospholipase D proteinase, partial [Chlamydia psittaci 03DC29]
IVPN